VSILAILLGFQNCGKVGFVSDYAGIYGSSGLRMSLEGGRPATNKKELAVQFDLSNQVFSEMRLSTSQDMDAKGIPWQPFSQTTIFDLGSDWAGDGSLDGMKNVYAELRAEPGAPPLPIMASIGLDTVAPMATGKGILASGIHGQVFNRGESVNLELDLSDPASNTGYSSGLAASGFRYGYSTVADCTSANVTWERDWGAPDGNPSIRWPLSSPLDAVYICAILQDNGGNTTTMLSQPLTSVWRVLAGDNNAGNGGSVNAANVRFKFPIGLAMNSKKDLVILDVDFLTFRKVHAQDVDGVSRLISTFIGNEHTGTPTEGDALATKLTGVNNGMVFDSRNRMYFSADGSIYRVTTNSAGNSSIKKIISICDRGSPMAVRKTSGREDLLIYSACESAGGLATSYAYLYSVPLSDLDARTTPLNAADLRAHYILAGNGYNPSSSYAIPTTQKLTAHDGPDYKYSVGYPGAITVGPNGEIYIASVSDPQKYPWGLQTVRRLTIQSDGSVLQEVLSKSIAWTNQLAHGVSSSGEPYLLASTVAGIRRLSLAPPTSSSGFNSPTVPSFVRNGEVIRGVVIQGNDVYVSVSTFSQVYHLDRDLNVLEILGRRVFNNDEPVATQAMIGQPSGMTQNPITGETYFFDPINHILRKVDTHGGIVTVAGQPGTPKSQIHNNVSFNSASFNGLSRFNFSNSGYPLTGEFSADGSVQRLYLGEGNVGRVHRFDLKTGLVKTVSGLWTTDAERKSSPNFLTISGLTVVPTASGPVLLTSRYCPADTCGNLSAVHFTGLITKANPATATENQSLVMGDLSVNFHNYSGSSPTGTPATSVPVYVTPTLRVDSVGNIFTSSYGFFMSKLSGSGLAPVTNINVNNTSRFYIPKFEVLEEGSKRYFIFSGGENLYVIQTNLSELTSGRKLVSTRLCLPGTFVKTVDAMTVTREGNLLIADSSNGRILEYYVRNSSGGLAPATCP
jgi:hypothetical protein